MDYNFRDIEKKWQKTWKEQKVYHVPNQSEKPKQYILDMFPYPSGAGLHVGHPLGYIASDIYARYKRLKGFNVLHPMGYDAFGLPAEQYAIEHGVHPAVSTEKNIETFRRQLDNIGFSFDWSREVRTSDPKFYKWTQWIFLQLFKSWYNRKNNRTESITDLIKIFKEEGNTNHPIPNSDFRIPNSQDNKFTADEWKSYDEKTQQSILMEYRIAYCGVGEVNWCEALGTVLANDEVVNGVSERGGYPVEKKKLRQWYLRITEYAERLLEGLQKVEFSDAMKEMQSNWIGKSVGAEIKFNLIRSDLTPNPSPKERGTLPGYHTTDLEHWKYLKEYSKINRKHATEAEQYLWQHLRNRQIKNAKFRRQHPIGDYIPDFVCIEKRIVIEVDGGYHDEKYQKLYDNQRIEFLQSLGYSFLIFRNDQVLDNLTSVIKRIEAALEQASPSPSERGSGGEVFTASANIVAREMLTDSTEGPGVRCFTTRPDTLFGVDFMVLAPEHELVEQITTPEQKQAVDKYIAYVKSRTERDRIAERNITGVFTGAYVEHPFNERQIPVWISEYVLAGYGTGAIMGVPAGDERDHKFAQHFDIPITNIFGESYDGTEAITEKDAILYNSDFLNGMSYEQAFELVLSRLEEQGIGRRKINYKMRDAAFSRQRYWGEPFPIIWNDGIAYPLDESELPLELPYVESYKPGPEGEGPLANIPEWVYQFSSHFGGGREGALETNTMPGYAGSSWYFLRYMDPDNEEEFCNKQISDYWNQVDLYVGGTEHAVGHLLYSRMWTKTLYDLGYISFDEPFKKLLNQGMIQGVSKYIYRFQNIDTPPIERKVNPVAMDKEWPQFDEPHLWYYSADSKAVETFDNAFAELIIPIDYVNHKDEVDLENFIKDKLNDKKVVFVTDNSIYINGKWKTVFKDEEPKITFKSRPVVEKMSKSKFNTVNPDSVVEKYGADTFRMYEMFLGPIDQSKPWDTKGIEGVHRFLKKLWRLFIDDNGFIVTDEKATNQELKILHKTIKKIEEDTERFSFNTAVSSFMICVNELTDLKCHKKEILLPLIILLQPYAPHVTEELYTFLEPSKALPNGEGLGGATFPHLEESYLVETSKEYPISINGKLRAQINIDLNASQEEVQNIVLADNIVQKWIEGKPVKKVIYVKGKMVNVVV